MGNIFSKKSIGMRHHGRTPWFLCTGVKLKQISPEVSSGSFSHVTLQTHWLVPRFSYKITSSIFPWTSIFLKGTSRSTSTLQQWYSTWQSSSKSMALFMSGKSHEENEDVSFRATKHFSLKILKCASILFLCKKAESPYEEVEIFFWNPHFHLDFPIFWEIIKKIAGQHLVRV